jgi:phosphatidylglycerol---prolipoprotein diacylglyceryl transferase
VHSVAFEIGGFTIYWYGILTAVGFLVAFWTASKRAPREGIASEAIADLAPWLILGALVGARLFYVVSYWDEQFSDKPLWEIFMLRRSGLVFYGGLVGASIATIFFARAKRLPLWKFADVIAPSIALGHVFGRFGCVMTGCCYGKPTGMPWAIHYPPDHWTAGIGVHPTQIYESMLNLLLFFGLVALHRRKRFDGQIFAAYLIGYALLRGVVEVFRGDYPNYYFGLLTPAQVASALFFAGGLYLWGHLSGWRWRGLTAAPSSSGRDRGA